MLVSEMKCERNWQSTVKLHSRYLLQLCFDHRTEYDPDVVFNKNVIFSALCVFIFLDALPVQIFTHQNIQKF